MFIVMFVKVYALGKCLWAVVLILNNLVLLLSDEL